ncbi:MAG: hypothetical protein AAF218_09690 [Pseudomonadota bacterium]
MWKQVKAAWAGHAQRTQTRHLVSDTEVRVTKSEIQRLFAQELALMPQRAAERRHGRARQI